MNWEQYFRQIAHTVRLKSKDLNTQIGAVIVGKDNEIVSTGYNSFPRGIDDSIFTRQLRPEKYYFMAHAEQNAISNAARIGVSTNGCTMYVTCGIPCADCAKNIINAGITTLVCEVDLRCGAHGEYWEEHAKRSLIMFEESGVQVKYYE
jgi:dCMP deaminase